MPAVEIPLLKVARQSMSVVMDNNEWGISLWWQPNDRNWYISVSNVNDDMIVTGRRMVSQEKVLPDRYRVNLWCELIPGAETNVLGENPWGETHRLIARWPD